MSEVIVAFQGEYGANSELAARQYFGEEVQTLPCFTFENIFEALQQGKATYGMLPVENSVAGTVAANYELLMEHDVRVRGEHILPVHYFLLAPNGTTVDDVKQVKSHPQALAQCEKYLRRRGWQSIVDYDTAGAAKRLAENPDPHTAALANEYAGQLYKLDVLERGVEDDPTNSTRFFVIGRDDAERCDPSKTSLAFAVRHRPSALYRCLGAFATHDINLTKLESRAMRGQPWQYLFYLDFEGHWQEPHIEAALVELLRQAAFVKMFGSYPAAKGGPNSR